ncbi:pirin-like C-terminal cupin domain-containing protein [Sphingomonas carotinifaciens]|uniref:Pirin C-terminal domain-containing protein n=1 Tax=Sphingomonas carotinifaciens TaxID=1166323 RepID=A0A1G7QAP6_9SPHN|nr:pirin-like C-terminal cupin domain-containing protein [Sphingomonas carotinifaciens]SDF95515.1 hypothetical protein SAMN05216557_10829 [Sphingomonas carotinifaciens]
MLAVVRLAAGAAITLPAPRARSVLFYTVAGSVEVGGDTVAPWQLATFADDGEVITVRSAAGAVLLFGHADPIDEPVVAHGPFVMTTREEISDAIRDYQAGRFNGTGPLLDVGA